MKGETLTHERVSETGLQRQQTQTTDETDVESMYESD